jgi:branched-chain amino acid transport system ATP-binding protein
MFDGEDITGQPAHAIVKKGISRSFQIMNLFDDYTALQNITVALPNIRQHRFNMLLNVRNDEAITDRAFNILEQIDLAQDAHIQAKSLPYGKRRALEIGVALATNPKMLFLDEPTQGLGSEQIASLSALIDKLREKVTLVIIEHDMSFLFGVADVISVVHWGQVIASGTPRELRQNKWVRASDLGAI